jgi:hypothetical protein
MTSTPTSYILRDIDRTLWTRFKARAATEGRGRGLKFVMLRLVELYATVGLEALETVAQQAREPIGPPA